MSDYVDPEELPFTRDELFFAFRLFLPEARSHEIADHLAECGPALVAHRAERRKGWREAGVPNADSLLEHGWEYPAELLPALASLSPDLASRVHDLEIRLARRLG